MSMFSARVNLLVTKQSLCVCVLGILGTLGTLQYPMPTPKDGPTYSVCNTKTVYQKQKKGLSRRRHRRLCRVTLSAITTLSRAFPQADKDQRSLRLTRAQREADRLRAVLWSNGINPAATVGNPSSAATARIGPKAARQREKQNKGLPPSRYPAIPRIPSYRDPAFSESRRQRRER